MKANQLATLVLRLLGIYCLIVFVSTVSFFSVFFYAQNGAFVFILAGLFLILWLAAGISLIVRSVPWGEKLTPKDAGDEKITVASFEQIQILAFAVAGVLIFAGELPQLFNSIFSLFLWLHQNPDKNPYPINSFSSNSHLILTAIGTLLKAALGLWLFFGARGFANFWRFLRIAGTPKPPEAP
jgi:hypothetical protein